MNEEKTGFFRKYITKKNILWCLGSAVLIVLAFLLAYAVTTFLVI